MSKFNQKGAEITTRSTGGVGFGGLLTLLFIGLKLGGIINWSWWWVLSPLWIPIGILIILLVFIGLIVGIEEYKK